MSESFKTILCFHRVTKGNCSEEERNTTVNNLNQYGKYIIDLFCKRNGLIFSYENKWLLDIFQWLSFVLVYLLCLVLLVSNIKIYVSDSISSLFWKNEAEAANVRLSGELYALHREMQELLLRAREEQKQRDSVIK